MQCLVLLPIYRQEPYVVNWSSCRIKHNDKWQQSYILNNVLQTNLYKIITVDINHDVR